MIGKPKQHVFANDRLRISVTSCCNFKCIYCTNEGQAHNDNDFISIEFIKRLSDFIKTNGIYIKKINITGGEPLLHPGLVEIVTALNGCADSLTLNTNGELLDSQKIIALKNAGINCIKFGIDSFFQKATKPFYKKTACNRERIMENFFFAKSAVPRTSINMVLTDFNYNEFEDNLNFCISNQIDLVEFLELITFDFRKRGETFSYGKPFAEVFKEDKAFFKKISYNIRLGKYLCETYNGLTMQMADDFCKSRVCRNLWTRIDAKGNLVPCIKARAKIKIDFSQLFHQAKMNNCLMCDAIVDKRIVRNYDGELLPENVKGDYHPSYTEIIQGSNIKFSELDL